MENMEKMCGQSQSFLDFFYFDPKVYFIYVLVLEFGREVRNLSKMMKKIKLAAGHILTKNIERTSWVYFLFDMIDGGPNFFHKHDSRSTFNLEL